MALADRRHQVDARKLVAGLGLLLDQFCVDIKTFDPIEVATTVAAIRKERGLRSAEIERTVRHNWRAVSGQYDRVFSELANRTLKA